MSRTQYIIAGASPDLFAWPELVYNGGMDILGEGQKVDGWTSDGNPGVYIRTTEQYHTGPYSMRYTFGQSSGIRPIAAIDSGKLVIGATYHVSAWFRGLDINLENSYWSLAFGDSSNDIVCPGVPYSNGIWVNLQGDVVLDTVTNVRVFVHLAWPSWHPKLSGKVAYFDDVSIRRIE